MFPEEKDTPTLIVVEEEEFSGVPETVEPETEGTKSAITPQETRDGVFAPNVSMANEPLSVFLK